jgi:hypothetical protein
MGSTSKPPQGSTIKPAAIALVLCDAIYQEISGKTALVGLFSNIIAQKVPVVHSRLAVFASVTGLREGSHAKLEIINAESEQPIATASGPFPTGTTPLTVADLNFVFNNLVFPEEGQYMVRFWANDHLLMQRPFQVSTPRQGKQE